MTNQQIKQSTWRERKVDLQPGVNEITFPDTKPNHILINNLGASVLTFGASIIPSLTIYDKQINPFGEMLYARDTGLTRCLIYVEGLDHCSIILTSFEDTFNPASLASSASTGVGGSGGSFDGVIRGIAVPLPSGNNNIGRVVVSTLPPIPPGTSKIGIVDITAPLPSGTNKIGKVEMVDPLPQGANKIGKVEMVDPLPQGSNKIGGVDITSSIPHGNNHIGVVTIQPKKRYFHEFRSVTTTEIEITLPFTVNEFNHITNDGDTDMYISFNDKKTNNGVSGEGSVIYLRAKESLTNFHYETTVIRLRRVSGVGDVRILGVN